MPSDARGRGDGTSHAPGGRFSDDDLLAVVHHLGLRADPASIRRALSARRQREFRRGVVERRIERLRGEGLLHLAPGGAADAMYVRLTAAGVERLQSRQREPVKSAPAE